MPNSNNNNNSNKQASQISDILSVSLSEIQRGLGRVEGKLDQSLINQAEHEKADEHRFSAVEDRMSNIEKKLWVWSGAIAVIVFVVSHFPYSLIFKG